MSKSLVQTLIDDAKILADYNITDSDLDQLILKAINFAIKRMKQWFFDESLLDEIGAHDTFTTTASLEYIDLAGETPDFDQQIILSERTNDDVIPIITFSEYRKRYPDPTANTSLTADVAAFFANRIYLGPTPSTSGTTYYLDYIKLLPKLTLGGTIPFEDKYDELINAIIDEYLIKFFDRTNRAAIQTAREDTAILRHTLITAAAKNVGMNQQSQSRKREVPYFAPRKVIN